MSVSMSGLELSGGEGVLGGSCRGDTDETGGVVVKGAVTPDAEVGASKEGSLGEAKVSNAWIVSSEDGEIPGPAEMEAAGDSTGGFLEGVVTNLITDGVGS